MKMNKCGFSLMINPPTNPEAPRKMLIDFTSERNILVELRRHKERA
jgi:hypothetical protein